MAAIHSHEIHHEVLPPAISARLVLEILELPALFLVAASVCAVVLGAVPWWLFAGAAFYGTLSAAALGGAVWRPRR